MSSKDAVMTILSSYFHMITEVADTDYVLKNNKTGWLWVGVHFRLSSTPRDNQVYRLQAAQPNTMAVSENDSIIELSPT